MKYPVYCVRDVKVGFQPQLLIEQNDATAIRGFSYAINTEGLMNYSPKDYELYKIGDFDTENGKFDVIIPENICSGASVFEGNE